MAAQAGGLRWTTLSQSVLTDAQRFAREAVPFAEATRILDQVRSSGREEWFTTRGKYDAFTFSDLERSRPFYLKRSASGADSLEPFFRVRFTLVHDTLRFAATGFGVAEGIFGHTVSSVVAAWERCSNENDRPALLEMLNSNITKGFFFRCVAITTLA